MLLLLLLSLVLRDKAKSSGRFVAGQPSSKFNWPHYDAVGRQAKQASRLAPFRVRIRFRTPP